MIRKKHIHISIAIFILFLITIASIYIVFKLPSSADGLIIAREPDLKISFESLQHKLKENIDISPDSTLVVSGTMQTGALKLTISQNQTEFSTELRPNLFSYIYANISFHAFQDGAAQLTLQSVHAQNSDLKFQIVSPLPGYDDAMLFSNFQIYSKQNGGYDIYDSQQNFLTKAYAKVTSSGQSLLYVAKDADNPNLLCAIDSQGNEVWPSVFTAVNTFMLPPYLFDYVTIENRTGVLDSAGKLIVPFGDIDIHHSKVLPDGNLQIEVGAFGMADESLNPVPYPCLDEPGTYLFAPDGTLLSHE